MSDDVTQVPRATPEILQDLKDHGQLTRDVIERLHPADQELALKLAGNSVQQAQGPDGQMHLVNSPATAMIPVGLAAGGMGAGAGAGALASGAGGMATGAAKGAGAFMLANAAGALASKLGIPRPVAEGLIGAVFGAAGSKGKVAEEAAEMPPNTTTTTGGGGQTITPGPQSGNSFSMNVPKGAPPAQAGMSEFIQAAKKQFPGLSDADALKMFQRTTGPTAAPRPVTRQSPMSDPEAMQENVTKGVQNDFRGPVSIQQPPGTRQSPSLDDIMEQVLGTSRNGWTNPTHEHDNLTYPEDVSDTQNYLSKLLTDAENAKSKSTLTYKKPTSLRLPK